MKINNENDELSFYVNDDFWEANSRQFSLIQ